MLSISVPEANPNVSGKDSTSSTTSTGSEEGTTSDSDRSDIEGDFCSAIDSITVTGDGSRHGLFSLKVCFALTTSLLICCKIEYRIFLYIVLAYLNYYNCVVVSAC